MNSINYLIIFLMLLLNIQNSYAQTGDEEWVELLGDEKYAEARLVLEKQLDESPENAEKIISQIGITYFAERNYEKYYKWSENATKLYPKNLNFHMDLVMACAMNLGIFSLLTGGASKCLKHVEKMLETDPHNVIAHFILSQYYLFTPGILGGSMKKAKYHANAIMKIDSCQGYKAWASIFNYDEEYDKAEEYFNKAIRIDTTSDQSSSQDLGSYYESRKEYKKAIQVYEQILEKKPDNMETNYKIGACYEHRKEYDNAIQVYEQILTKKPDEKKAVYKIGVCQLEAKKNFIQAEDNFRKYLSITKSKSELAEGHWSLGRLLNLQSKKDSALTHLKKAVELRPKNKEYAKTLEEVQKNK